VPVVSAVEAWLEAEAEPDEVLPEEVELAPAADEPEEEAELGPDPELLDEPEEPELDEPEEPEVLPDEPEPLPDDPELPPDPPEEPEPGLEGDDGGDEEGDELGGEGGGVHAPATDGIY